MSHDFVHQSGENAAVNHTAITLIARWWRELGRHDTGFGIEVKFESQPVRIMGAARKTVVGFIANQGVLLLRMSGLTSPLIQPEVYCRSSSTFLWNAGKTLV